MASKKNTAPAPKSKPVDGSISRAGFADSVDASRVHRTFKVLPSAIIAKHSNNHDRAPLYSLTAELPELAGHPAFGGEDAFCFTRAEVLARADSFTKHGQEMAVRFDRTATGLCSLSAGYLRHAAALYLEVTGRLKDCAPNGAGDRLVDGLLGLAADSPKTLEGQIAAVWHSGAENERKATTPIDLAWKIRRLSQLQVPMTEVCSRLGISASTASSYLRLLTLPVATQLAVHEGKLGVTKALADASTRGEGSAIGPRPGVRHTSIRRALNTTPAEHPRPKAALTAKQVEALLDAIAGGEAIDPTVSEWVSWANPPKPERAAKPVDAVEGESKQPRKKFPRRVGKQGAQP